VTINGAAKSETKKSPQLGSSGDRKGLTQNKTKHPLGRIPLSLDDK
jgi:hypothetical protein